MLPNGANVFCTSSSVSPLVSPPQYTVQLVGLDWLYTSSNVSGLVLAGKKQQQNLKQKKYKMIQKKVITKFYYFYYDGYGVFLLDKSLCLNSCGQKKYL